MHMRGVILKQKVMNAIHQLDDKVRFQSFHLKHFLFKHVAV